MEIILKQYWIDKSLKTHSVCNTVMRYRASLKIGYDETWWWTLNITKNMSVLQLATNNLLFPEMTTDGNGTDGAVELLEPSNDFFRIDD